MRAIAFVVLVLAACQTKGSGEAATTGGSGSGAGSGSAGSGSASPPAPAVGVPTPPECAAVDDNIVAVLGRDPDIGPRSAEEMRPMIVDHCRYAAAPLRDCLKAATVKADIATCNKQHPTPVAPGPVRSCAEVAAHAEVLAMRDLKAGARATAEDRDKGRQALIGRCESQHWSGPWRACMAAAPDYDTYERCDKIFLPPPTPEE